jgi:hypothetical protein
MMKQQYSMPNMIVGTVKKSMAIPLIPNLDGIFAYHRSDLK